MPYLIGMDEAGYGPNLGPLVVSASVWHVRRDWTEGDLYRWLAGVIKRAPRPEDNRLVVADSKVVYRSGHGLGTLERGLLPAVAVCHGCVVDWTELWHMLGVDATGQRHGLPWYDEFRLSLPLANDAVELAELADQLNRALAAAGVRLHTIQSRAVFPEQFNALVEEYGRKSDVLSRSSMQLLAEVLLPRRAEPIHVVCDKHGGRNRYGAFLQRQFPDRLIEVCRESRAESVYRWGPGAARIEARFRTGGENFLPTALASMASKYIRELAMRAENEFWGRRVAGLRPTAGYPVDARRFKADIAARQKQLAIDDRILWRVR